MAKVRRRDKVKLGLLGSGTVGEAVQDFVFQDVKLRAGNEPELEIVKIYTRHPQKKKRYAAHPALFTTKPEEVTDHPEADIVIEALGCQREEELADFKNYIIRAFRKGKSVVTSDKAVLAKYGREIWSAAEEYDQELRFEACVGGGIPIIRSLTESFAREEPEAIYGIVNGTCNYVLSEMKGGGKSFEEALREAQERGYAETNPEFDISGRDAEAKLILLAAVTFGLDVKPGVLLRQGVEQIHSLDFQYADRKGGSTIKHVAVARRNGGSVEAFVSPVLVRRDHLLSAIDGPTNAFFFKGKRSDETRGEGETDGRDWNYVFVGPGAGGRPTAIAILGDVCELGRGRPRRAARCPNLFAHARMRAQPGDEIKGCFYIRFVVIDKAGIVGDMGQAFGRTGINISEIWQLSHTREELMTLANSYRLSETPANILPFVITVENATVRQIKEALTLLGQKDYILVDPVWLPIWNKN
jgi:homoserine dehydrogenase